MARTTERGGGAVPTMHGGDLRGRSVRGGRLLTMQESRDFVPCFIQYISFVNEIYSFFRLFMHFDGAIGQARKRSQERQRIRYDRYHTINDRPPSRSRHIWKEVNAPTTAAAPHRSGIGRCRSVRSHSFSAHGDRGGEGGATTSSFHILFRIFPSQ